MTEQTITCPHCKDDNPSSAFFCGKCGKFLKKAEYDDEAFYATNELKLMRILENISRVPHSKVIWDDTIDLCVKKVEELKCVFNLDDLNVKKLNSELTITMDDFLAKCRTPEFQIAFVGTIKTGKSTLINSLLGKNYASMDVTPETAALTKFRYSPKDYVNVTFYNKTEWAALWKSRTSAADAFMEEYNELHAEDVKDKWVGHEPVRKEVENLKIKEELTQWSSSKHAEHYFVKEIEVGISTLPNDMPSEVVFVDTPGLSDPVSYRSDITKNYIRHADAVFVCVDAQKISKEEIETISSVFSFSSDNKEKVFIIATHWDAMNNLEKDWKKQYDYLLDRLVGKAFYDSKDMAKRNIMYSAAYIYNLCRDINSLNRDDLKSLLSFSIKLDFLTLDDVKENLDLLKEKTNVRHILETITNVLIRNYKGYLMSELGREYNHILYDLRRIGNEKFNQEKGLVEMSGESLAEIKEKLKEISDKQKNMNKVQDDLTASLASIRKITEERLTKVLEVFDSYINEQYS